MHKDTKIELVDTHTKRVLYTSTYRNVKRMRTRADKLDMQHGSYRYVVRVDYDHAWELSVAASFGARAARQLFVKAYKAIYPSLKGTT